MALNTVLALAAGIGFAGTAQDPSLDMNIATPVLNDTQGVAATTNDTRVTVQFRDAKVSEVLQWLENRGINFVVSNDDIPREARLTLNLQDMPLDSAVDAIADALGGRWQRERGVRIFKKGRRAVLAPDVRIDRTPLRSPRAQGGLPPRFAAPSMPGMPAMPSMPAMPPMPAMPNMPDVHVWKFSDKDGKLFTSPDAPKDWDKQFGPEFQKRMEEWGKRMQKEFGPEFQEKMRKWAEEAGKNGQYYMFDGAKGYKLDGDAFKKLKDKKGMEADVFKKLRSMDGNAFGRGLQESKRYRSFARSGSNNDVFFLNSKPLDIRKLLKSLTPNQRDTQSKRGYIWYDDLTSEQKALLGERPSGRFEYKFKINGEEIGIRGN